MTYNYDSKKMEKTYTCWCGQKGFKDDLVDFGHQCCIDYLHSYEYIDRILERRKAPRP